MKIKGDIVDKVLAGFIILFIVLCVLVIQDTAEGYERSAPRAMRDHRPEIPQCDKELWLRIKDGCADEE